MQADQTVLYCSFPYLSIRVASYTIGSKVGGLTSLLHNHDHN